MAVSPASWEQWCKDAVQFFGLGGGDFSTGGMVMKILKDRRGYSMTFWAIFFGFIMIPIMALGIEVGRYFYARAEIAKAADAAALAAAVEINQRIFEASGKINPYKSNLGECSGLCEYE
jgi:Flp pilus assembly protein TadG